MKIFYTLALSLFIQFSFANNVKDSLLNATKVANDTSKVLAWIELSNIDAKADSATKMGYLLNALKLSESIKYHFGIGSSLNQIGRQYQLIGNAKKAIEYYQKSESHFRKINSIKGLAAVMANYGVAHKELGEIPKATSCYIEAAKYFEKLEDKKGIANCYNNLGNVYKIQKNFPKAFESYHKALRIRKEIGNKRGLLSSYTNLGSCFLLLDQFDSSLYYNLKGLPLADEVNDPQVVSIITGNIGLIYDKKGDNLNAIRYYKKGLEISQEINDAEGISFGFLSLGTLNIKLGKYNEAISDLNKSLQVAREIGSLVRISETYLALADVYEKTGNYKAAFEAQLNYTNSKDSLLNIETAKQVSELSTIYETEKKQKEIELLNKDKALKQVELNKKDLEVTQKRTERNAFILGFALVLVLAGVSFQGYKQKKRANILLHEQKEQIEFQKEVVEEQHREITDSIKYGVQIQRAMLPFEERIKKSLSDFFVLYQPKDLVSGDFYWFQEKNGKKIVAVVDCTGHGVPGAFMSMIGNELLNDIVGMRGITNPGLILSELHKGIRHALKQDETGSRDGMDVVLCTIDEKNNKIEFAGAMNPLYYVREGELQMVKGTKLPIGGIQDEEERIYETTSIEIKSPMSLYLLTDGYADQFGGPKGKKFKYKQLEDLLLEFHTHPSHEQKQVLTERFSAWKGNHDQVDDVTIIGIRV